MTNHIPIGPGTRVRLTFSLSLESGELIDTTGDKPVSFVVGDGNFLPGFEQAIFGLTSGQENTLKVTAKSGFGLVNEANIQQLKRSQFPKNMELTVGLMISFADAQNTELPGVIVSMDSTTVAVDFNHPLAGKDIIFNVNVLAVEQISNEIIRVSE